MSEYWTRRRALTTTKDADDDDDDDDGNLLRVKDPPPHEWKTLPRACKRVCTTPSLHRKHKKAPRPRRPREETKNDATTTRSQRERERERERNKKRALLVPAAGDDPHGRHYIVRGIGCCVDPNTHKLERRQNATRRRPLLLFRERSEL